MKTKINKLKLINRLIKKYPLAWWKDGELFDNNENCLVWTGEGSMYDNWTPLFDYYAETDIYQCGVHVELAEYLRKQGLFCECYDAGTYLIYAI